MVALTAAMAQLADCWQLLSHALTSPSGVMALAALALTGMLIAMLAHGARIAATVTGRPLVSRGVALRQKSWGAAFQRQLDPDAPGRARPRAPAAVPAVA